MKTRSKKPGRLAEQLLATAVDVAGEDDAGDAGCGAFLRGLAAGHWLSARAAARERGLDSKEIAAWSGEHAPGSAEIPSESVTQPE